MGKGTALACGLVVFLSAACEQQLASSELTKSEPNTIDSAESVSDLDRYRLKIDRNGREQIFSTEELLSRSDVEDVNFLDVAAYPDSEMTYRAIRFANLMDELQIDKSATLVFVAEDDFAAPIRSEMLLNTSPDGSVAYLAIENPLDRWPPFRSGQGTAGPFYVFWINPELSNIGREEWPYKFNSITIKDSFESLYNDIYPDLSGADAAEIEAGYNSFVKNCFACHKVNQVGPGVMGPDLNFPRSPTEYFHEEFLKMFIRDPKSVRENPRGVMAGFDEEEISDVELDQLLAYLKHMAARR